MFLTLYNFAFKLKTKLVNDIHQRKTVYIHAQIITA
jgi:hypothetical protein